MVVTSGVPWGSILWPVLFSLFLSDVDVGIECIITKFDDDNKLECAADSFVG